MKGKGPISVLVFLVSSAFAKENLSTLTIEIIHHPDTADRSIAHLYVRQQAQTLFCKTDDIPEHGIRISGFQFKPPFKNERQLESNCLKAIRWGNSQTCYKFRENKILDELFRQCFGF